jgi:hypothetical protein
VADHGFFQAMLVPPMHIPMHREERPYIFNSDAYQKNA